VKNSLFHEILLNCKNVNHYLTNNVNFLSFFTCKASSATVLKWLGCWTSEYMD